MAANLPLRFEINGSVFSGYDLGFRRDLATADIADGMAAFDIVCRIQGARIDQEYAITVSDSSGLACDLFCPTERVKRFAPQGAIDSMGPGFVAGWVFDPAAGDGGVAPRLLLDGERLWDLSPTIERADLSFDMGTSLKQFGFEVPIEGLRAVILGRGERFEGRSALLTLASSGRVLSHRWVRVTAGAMDALDGPTVAPGRGKARESELLDRLWAGPALTAA
jgi:hypothetical protein